ncbi:MAG: T9SS type A sorting domain-containing protein [candidate division Zixibacteria bacterium]|nr:T9SS type A sorting domain-containing protein [candidate division Zixibacteria bacterium]NIR63275.1 T9SS type A sorting domain-containing protein [candidate division Zixibacteria bacterium]NIS15670.1 T9SS type A sorting domain-containing protein [candidate division Zixibacteria bacterium]NIS44718.1 T9SS type A sorting domain-containing protein [candidate division Zixibacteria bacterium]NIU12815.1 T9SS type A sorting domain-containing protein [candidate division Zixibacteria bacterium]
MRRLISYVILILAGVVLTAPNLMAQGESTVDTLRFGESYGLPGDTVEMILYLKNASLEVASWNLQYRFDTTVIKPIVETDGTNFYPTYELIGPMTDWVPFGAVGAGLNYFPESPLGPLVTGIFPGDPDQPVTASIGGPWQIMKVFFEIQEGVALNTETTVDLFSDFSTSGGIIITISDVTGLEIVEPTLVDGTVIVADTTGPVEPDAPVIDPITSPITVQQNETVNFTVRATDPEGLTVTLSALNLPTGATFPEVTGTGEVTGTFNWPSAQPGTWNVTFRAIDADNLTTQRSVQIIVQEILRDEIYVASSEELGTSGGIAGTPGVAVPIDLRDIQTIYGIQFDLQYDNTVCRVDSITPTERLAGFTIYDNIVEANVLRIVTFGTNNESVQPSEAGRTIMYVWMTVNTTALAGSYPLTILNAYESIDPDPGVGSIPLEYRDDGIFQVDALGDVNLHPPVDVADLVSLVGYIIGDWSLTERQFRAANVNADTEANVVDLVSILNYILGLSTQPNPTSSYAGPDAEVDIDLTDLIAGETGLMRINADLPADVGGAQMEITYDPQKVMLDAPQLAERSGEFYLRYSDKGDGRMVVLMHYKSNSAGTIPAGLGDILSVPVYAIDDVSETDGRGGIRLNKVVLSSSEGSEIPVKGYGPTLPTRFNLSQNYPNPFNPSTTITFEILASNNNPGGAEIDLVIYNILGQKVKTLTSGFYAPGEYSIVWDGTDDFGDKQASGVYFYSLISEDTRKTKKMVLTK